jgi:hypothetical protein
LDSVERINPFELFKPFRQTSRIQFRIGSTLFDQNVIGAKRISKEGFADQSVAFGGWLEAGGPFTRPVRVFGLIYNNKPWNGITEFDTVPFARG